MQSILDAINEWIKEILIGAINGNLSTMFGDVNEKVGTIAAEVGQTPQGWNANIFSMIQTLSENVIVPIAGLVITYVLCYELISMVTEKNNMHDVDCRYCLHYRRRSCQVRTCPYIAERLKSGAIEYLDLILEYFGHIPHAGLHKRIQAVEHWSGPDQAVLHTVSVHLRSRFADRVWDDAPPGYLAALYLLASKERLWQPALPALSHDSIDFSRIVSKPHGFAIQD